MKFKTDESLKKGLKLIKKAKTVYIFPHLNADGDAIGSGFGIAYILKDMGKKVKVFLEEDPGDRLRYLLEGDVDYAIADETGEFSDEAPDLSVVNDCSDSKRVGKRWALAEKANAILKIDHHVQVDNFGNVNFVNENWSATCEGAFLLAKALKYDFNKARHGKNAAISIYSGLLTDSGQFGYSNTTPFTHIVASELLKTIGDVSDYTRILFETKPYSKVKIFGRAYERAELFADNAGAFTYITLEDIKECASLPPDYDGISASLSEVKGIEVSAFARPSGGTELKWKISLRSYKYCDVAKLAVSHGGGGHVRAAGFEYEGTLEDLKKILIEEISREIEQGRNTQY